MDARDYFNQEWQIHSKWYASSSCFSVRGVCAEKNTGTHHRLSGKSTMIDSRCLLEARRPGAFQSQLSSLPPFLQMGKLMLGDLKIIAQSHAAWYWQSHSSFHLSWLCTQCPWPSPGPSPGVLTGNVPSHSFSLNLFLTLFSCLVSDIHIIWVSVLKRNPTWNASLLLSMILLSQGFCWGIAERDMLQMMDGHRIQCWDQMSKSRMVKKEPEPTQHLGTGWC